MPPAPVVVVATSADPLSYKPTVTPDTPVPFERLTAPDTDAPLVKFTNSVSTIADPPTVPVMVAEAADEDDVSVAL